MIYVHSYNDAKDFCLEKELFGILEARAQHIRIYDDAKLNYNISFVTRSLTTVRDKNSEAISG